MGKKRKAVKKEATKTAVKAPVEAPAVIQLQDLPIQPLEKRRALSAEQPVEMEVDVETAQTRVFTDDPSERPDVVPSTQTLLMHSESGDGSGLPKPPDCSPTQVGSDKTSEILAPGTPERTSESVVRVGLLTPAEAGLSPAVKTEVTGETSVHPTEPISGSNEAMPSSGEFASTALFARDAAANRLTAQKRIPAAEADDLSSADYAWSEIPSDSEEVQPSGIPPRQHDAVPVVSTDKIEDWLPDQRDPEMKLKKFQMPRYAWRHELEKWIADICEGIAMDDEGVKRKRYQTWRTCASMVQKADYSEHNQRKLGSLFARATYRFGNAHETKLWLESKTSALWPFLTMDNQIEVASILLREKYIPEIKSQNPVVLYTDAQAGFLTRNNHPRGEDYKNPTINNDRPVYVSKALIEYVIRATLPNMYAVLFGSMHEHFRKIAEGFVPQLKGNWDDHYMLLSLFCFAANTPKGGKNHMVIPPVHKREEHQRFVTSWIIRDLEEILKIFGDAINPENEESVFLAFDTKFAIWMNMFDGYVLEHSLYDVLHPDAFYPRDANIELQRRTKVYQARFEFMIGIKQESLRCHQKNICESRYASMMMNFAQAGVFDEQRAQGRQSASSNAWPTLLMGSHDKLLQEFAMDSFSQDDLYDGKVAGKSTITTGDITTMFKKAHLRECAHHLEVYLGLCRSLSGGAKITADWTDGAIKVDPKVNLELTRILRIPDLIERRASALATLSNELLRVMKISDAQHVSQIIMPVGTSDASVLRTPDVLSARNLETRESKDYLEQARQEEDARATAAATGVKNIDLMDLLEESRDAMFNGDVSVDLNQLLRMRLASEKQKLKEAGDGVSVVSSSWFGTEADSEVFTGQFMEHLGGISNEAYEAAFHRGLSDDIPRLTADESKEIELQSRREYDQTAEQTAPTPFMGKMWRRIGVIREEFTHTSEASKVLITKYASQIHRELQSESQEWTEERVHKLAFTRKLHNDLEAWFTQMANFQKVVQLWEKVTPEFKLKDFMVPDTDLKGNPKINELGIPTIIYRRVWQFVATRRSEIVDVEIRNDVAFGPTIISAHAEFEHMPLLDELFGLLLDTPVHIEEFDNLNNKRTFKGLKPYDRPSWPERITGEWPHVFWRTVTNKETEAMRFLNTRDPTVAIRHYVLGKPKIDPRSIKKARSLTKNKIGSVRELQVEGADGTMRLIRPSAQKETAQDHLRSTDKLPQDFKPNLRPDRPAMFRLTEDNLAKSIRIETILEDPLELESGDPLYEPAKCHPMLQVTREAINLIGSKALTLAHVPNLTGCHPFIKERLSLKHVEELHRNFGKDLQCHCTYVHWARGACICKAKKVDWIKYLEGRNMFLQCSGCLKEHPHEENPTTDREAQERLSIEVRKAAIRQRVIYLPEGLQGKSDTKLLSDQAALEVMTEIKEFDQAIQTFYYRHATGIDIVPASLLNLSQTNWLLNLSNPSVVKSIRDFIYSPEKAQAANSAQSEHMLTMQTSFGFAYELSMIDQAEQRVQERIMEGYGARPTDIVARKTAVICLLREIAAAYWTAYYHCHSERHSTGQQYAHLEDGPRLKLFVGNYVAKAICHGDQLSRRDWEFIKLFVQETKLGGWHFIDELLHEEIAPSNHLLHLHDYVSAADDGSSVISSGSMSAISDKTFSDIVSVTSQFTNWTATDEWSLVFSAEPNKYERELASDTCCRLYHQTRRRRGIR